MGRRRRISLAKAESREEGEREVVIRTRGSTNPERLEYSSSRSRDSWMGSSGWDSSNL